MGAKTKLSAAVLALILGGATADKILDQFLDEKEGVRTIAYQDGRGIWSICRGLTRIEGKPVTRGLKLSYSQCKRYDAVERDKAIAWVRRNVTVPLSEPAVAGIASFCPYNIGPAKCFPSTFYKKLNAGDRIGACAEIKRWIFDGGRDCRIKANNCAGQPVRRGQESELTCWDIDK
ncbi:lysozyme [Hafnia alvei]|uniref:lysozyme n=1 Tax=Hafnia TaxID=568 RepID=UPI0029DB4981|nr:lysozyme [Hafnia alvei]MDX6845476.1 lysozyme [Hafnia alvei]